MEKNFIILLGPPGSGKGSQGTKLKEKLSIPHVASGELLRAEIRANTPRGIEVKSYIDQGKLGPDSLINDILFHQLDQPNYAKGCILDGFPRKVSQAEALNNYLGSKIERTLVLNFELSDKIIVERLSGRLICSECSQPYHVKFSPPQKDGICDLCGSALYQRSDDTKEVIEHRLKVYRDQTAPLVEYYKEKKLLVSIDCSPSPDEIFEEILKKIGM